MNEEDDLPDDNQQSPAGFSAPDETMSDEEYYASDEKAARAASLKKRKQILAGSIVFLLLMVALIVYSCQPPKGGIMYGVCRALLEQVVDYPPTIQQLYYEQFPRAVRIYYNHTDAFGQFQQDMIECISDETKYPDLAFKDVMINRKSIEADVIERFNKSIPMLMASDIDTTLPPPPKSYW